MMLTLLLLASTLYIINSKTSTNIYQTLFSYIFSFIITLITYSNTTLQMLNIPSTVNDPKYRYRYPKMQVKIESKGNGIKTNIVNLGQVAKHLRTNEQYILKWFGFEKASQTTFKEAGGKNNTNYIINGDFSEEDLRKVLDKFIQKYVCCPKCKLPEMYMTVNGDKINGKCDSCPFVGELDNKHKLATFILKNPPVYKSQATKVVKIEPEKKETSGVQGQKKDRQKKQEEIPVEPVIVFDANNMDFGSEQLKKFIEYIRVQIDKQKNQDFDIQSAKIASKIKPLNLKKPLIAFAVFNAFFTVNLNQQISEHSKLYLNLMKKLCQATSEIETLLNIEYLYLQAGKQKDYSKFLPTILYNIVKENMLSETFLVQWSKDLILNIDTNYLYNKQRDAQFKKIVKPYVQSLGEEQQQEQEECEAELVEATQ